jgi:hypothetical protein
MLADGKHMDDTVDVSLYCAPVHIIAHLSFV